MTIDEMKKRKGELGLTNEMLAEQSGVPLGTVQKIFAGITKAPRYTTILALERVLTPSSPEESPDRLSYSPSHNETDASVISDGAFSYLPRHSVPLTVEDILALPGEQRIELIDGIPYDMAPPSTLHQKTVTWLSYRFSDYIFQNRKPCSAYVSPVGVQLNHDDRTLLEPDLLILCDPEKVRSTHILGAPDLIVEVLSPATQLRDMTLKLYKYQDAGVREYWIIDTKNQRIIVYEFARTGLTHIYTFSDRVPVGIWDGSCSIDFNEFAEHAGSLLKDRGE